MADFKREHWLAIRATPSLGRTFRARSRFVHVSKTPNHCATKRQHWPGFFGSRQSVPGDTLKLGRNAARRALRTGPRKSWRALPRAA